MKKLYFGDHLDALEEQADAHPDGFIDLIFIDSHSLIGQPIIDI